MLFGRVPSKRCGSICVAIVLFKEKDVVVFFDNTMGYFFVQADNYSCKNRITSYFLVEKLKI